MRKKRNVFLALMMVLIMSLSLVSCGGEEDLAFSIGSWNGNTFENEWLDMAFEVPDDWYVAPEEEIADIIGMGAEVYAAATDGDADALAQLAELQMSYGFMVMAEDGALNSQLVYENLAMSGNKSITEEEYMDISLEQALEVDVFGYELVERGTEEIAGKTFTTAKLTGFDGAFCQDYYVYKQDKYMVCLIMSYFTELEDVSDEFISDIHTLEQ